MTDAHSVTAAELTSFLERYEQLAAEKQDVADQQKELMAELVGRGYDKKVFAKVVRDRKLKRDALAEFEAIEELYRQAVGLI